MSLWRFLLDSTIWVLVYKGEASAEPLDPFALNASMVGIVNSVPQNRTVLLKGLDGYFADAGFHTMEVLHQTPFGVDFLGAQPLMIINVISVRGAP